jgi:hypothetical protein
MEDEFTPSNHGCIRINGVGLFDSEFVFGKGSNICTCGALPEGTPWNQSRLTLHSLDCSSVLCPMCSLEPQPKQPGGSGGTTTPSTAG